MEVKGKNNENGSFDWQDALMDAGIMAGLTFFTAIGTGSWAGLPTPTALVAAAMQSGAQFFLMLAIKRGLREKKE